MATQNQTVKKILIAPDKFKGSLTSAQAAQAIRRGLEEKYSLPSSKLEFRIIEIADGGDGSLEVLQKKLPGSKKVEVQVHNPVGKEEISQILLYNMPGAGGDSGVAGIKCAFIEMAKVSGLQMLSKGERNPLNTSTYGMGEAVKAAIANGAKQITLSIGGSATNDGGAGMLQAFGYRFLDAQGVEIAAPICGGDLQRVVSVEAPAAEEQAGNENILSGITFKVICDVTNPLLGPQGATAVYGPQKGADARALVLLEAGLENYAATAEKCLAVSQGCKEYPGAGAAGGVGYAGLAFLNAELLPGWKFFAEITSLEGSVQWADLVITGEGSLDSQSLSGKVVSGVLNLAAQYNKRVAIFCGVNKLTPDEIETMASTLPEGVSCHSIASLGHPIDVCMRDAAKLLQQLASFSFSLRS